MDNQQMIENLKQAGIVFEAGMADVELDRAERVFGFRFPEEIRAFLGCGVPVGEKFFDYRDVSERNQERLRRFWDSVERSFRFDLRSNREEMTAMLGDCARDGEDLDDAVFRCLRGSVRLVPFYAHRCFFDGMDDMPIVSFWQPIDTIFYGGTFENYLEVEFLQKERVLEGIPERIRETGIWKEIIG